MSKYIPLLALLVVASLALAACDSVLDEEIVSGVTADTHYSTPAGFESAVNSAYQYLRDFYGDEHGGNLTQYGTDETTNAGHGGNRFMNFYDSGLNASAGPFDHIWTNFYEAINTCNVVVDRAPDVDMPEAEKTIRVAEARFLRAHYYFILVQFFGDIHLTLEETTGVETEADRDPASDVYAAIVSDLEDAIANLPAPAEAEYGRANRAAAEHMLALVLLTRSYQPFAEQDDLSRAVTLSQSVIDNYGLELLDDYAAVFDHDNERHAEVIWSVQYSQDQLVNGDGNRTHLYFRPWYENINTHLRRTGEPGYGRPWIRFRITTWALENFRPPELDPDGDGPLDGLDVDSRYSKIFQDVWYYNDTVPEGAALGDTAIYTPAGDISPEDSAAYAARLPGVHVVDWYVRESQYINMFPSLKKHDDFKRGADINETRGSRDFIVYRLAETYLIAAEALLQSEGADAAVPYLNEVRRRAAWDGMEAQMEVTSAEVDIDFILDERTRELYGEYKRWLDLKRTGKLIERVRAHNPEATGISDHHVLRPIPTDQILRTSGGYGQNDGY